jgi:hypothetical protein
MALCWKTHWYFTTSTLNLTEILIFSLFHWTWSWSTIYPERVYRLGADILLSSSSTKSTFLFVGLQHFHQCRARWLNFFHVLIKTKSENGFHNKHVNPQPLSREPSIISLANSSFLSLERTFINHCFMKILKYSQRSQLLDLTFKQFVEKYLAWIQSKTIKGFLRTRFNDFRQGSNKIKIVLFVD